MIENDTSKILDSVLADHRLERADAIRLLESNRLASIGEAAHAVDDKASSRDIPDLQY